MGRNAAMEINRVVLIVADSAGAGAMPDASAYGDVGCDTLGNIARAQGGISLPTLEKMGLGNAHDIKGVGPVEKPMGFFGRMMEQSAGKDTTTGHWEICGLITEEAFPTYPKGFPKSLIEAYEKAIGRGTLGNYPASGTEIIAQLGQEHMKTGSPIVYTSADSVFQIACHEEVIPIDKLYEICEIARGLLRGEHAVSRVIARPFLGTPGSFYRTERRKDFSLAPSGDTLLDLAKSQGISVVGVGKIEDIFVHRGLTESYHTGNNQSSLQQTEKILRENKSKAIIFVNLVDFDMVYGHRRNVEGYARALVDFDSFLPRIITIMHPDDMLIITADHGCDPTMPGTDHTREMVPLLCFSQSFGEGAALGTRKSFADITATIMELMGIKGSLAGESFAPHLR
jgi:phosphopentomutase